MLTFKRYEPEDYDSIVSFLIRLNEDDYTSINWNWARLEWMIEHPYLNKEYLHSMGLWFDNSLLVGVALFDLYLGEAFLGILPEYIDQYDTLLEYAFYALSDEDGIKIALSNKHVKQIEKALKHGFFKMDDYKEPLLKISLEDELIYQLDEEITIESIDPSLDYYNFQWMIWQGFDHGEDEQEFIEAGLPLVNMRPNFSPYLSVVALNKERKMVGYCCSWYSNETDYAYLEPLCVIPSYRHRGIAKALVYETLNRARRLGAKKAFVISDMDFYKKLGFEEFDNYYFYHKKLDIKVNDNIYHVKKLLGKGKGGYSYLAFKDDIPYVLKQIHHEPCDYYSFGNKIEAEKRDYERLKEAGIRIPKLIEIDETKEIIIKEYIEGEIIFDLVKNNIPIDKYIIQVEEMASLSKNVGLNIDYFPTNFIVKDDLLYYIDYECNEYMDEWNFSNWGIKYWSKSKEFLEYLENH